MEVEKINWPFGPAAHEKPAYTATIALTIKNQRTIIEPAILTGNLTLDLTIDSQVQKGAIIDLTIKTTATETTTLGTGIDGPAVVGVAGKTWTQSFFYDGVSFKPCGAKIQID